ncbi:DUF3164 family protein [bacterium]|nr:DUF3164 family protein [bacterium]
MPKKKEFDGVVYWVDAEGSMKREDAISKADKQKEEIVDDIFAGVFHAHDKLVDFKKHIIEALDAYIEKAAKKAKVEGWKGNFQLVNYDSTRRIVVKRAELLNFNEKLQFAKSKFDEWVIKKTENGDADLAEIVQKAFEVDKAGGINKSFLFKLLRYSIKDPEFKKAQELLRESVETYGTKTYIQFQIKNEQNAWDTITLDFASL